MACWIAYLRTGPQELSDPLAGQLRAARSVSEFLALLDPALAADDDVISDLGGLVAELQGGE